MLWIYSFTQRKNSPEVHLLKRSACMVGKCNCNLAMWMQLTIQMRCKNLTQSSINCTIRVVASIQMAFG